MCVWSARCLTRRAWHMQLWAMDHGYFHLARQYCTVAHSCPLIKHHSWLIVVVPWWPNGYCDFCVWVDRQHDVIIIINRPRSWYCRAVNEKRNCEFLLFSLFCDGTVVWHLWQFRCIFIARWCIFASSLKISLDKLAFLAKLGIILELKLEHWSL